jgi:hypothetical protein
MHYQAVFGTISFGLTQLGWLKIHSAGFLEVPIVTLIGTSRKPLQIALIQSGTGVEGIKIDSYGGFD